MKYAKPIIAILLVIAFALGTLIAGYFMPDEGMFMTIIICIGAAVAVGLVSVVMLNIDVLTDGNELIGILLLFMGLISPQAGVLFARHTPEDFSMGSLLAMVTFAMAVSVCEKLYIKDAPAKAVPAT